MAKRYGLLEKKVVHHLGVHRAIFAGGVGILIDIRCPFFVKKQIQ